MSTGSAEHCTAQRMGVPARRVSCWPLIKKRPVGRNSIASVMRLALAAWWAGSGLGFLGVAGMEEGRGTKHMLRDGAGEGLRGGCG